MAHTFNPSTPEAEAGVRPAWSTEQFPGQPGLLHRETLSRQQNKQKTKLPPHTHKMEVSIYLNPRTFEGELLA